MTFRFARYSFLVFIMAQLSCLTIDRNEEVIYTDMVADIVRKDSLISKGHCNTEYVVLELGKLSPNNIYNIYKLDKLMDECEFDEILLEDKQTELWEALNIFYLRSYLFGIKVSETSSAIEVMDGGFVEDYVNYFVSYEMDEKYLNSDALSTHQFYEVSKAKYLYHPEIRELVDSIDFWRRKVSSRYKNKN